MERRRAGAKPGKPKPWKGTERQIQRAILQACDNFLIPEAIVFHAAQNRLTEREGKFWKALGVVPGVPDLIFYLPRGVTLGMEIKTPEGRLSPAQRLFHEKLKAMEHNIYVVRSVDEALKVLGWFDALKMKVEVA